ncbi:ferritin family protein [Candidatus Poribacteria bacterium]
MGVFNADQILEMAEQIERNGARFYRIAARNTEASQGKQILLDLAADEVEHEKVFAAMRAEIQKQKKTISDYPVLNLEDDEYSLYLQAVADGHVFDIQIDPSEALTGEETAEDIFQIALAREKDAVVFYLGMKNMVSESQGKDKVERIVKEEVNHVTIISKKLAELNQ